MTSMETLPDNPTEDERKSVYFSALAYGLSDAEAREEGWPTEAPRPETLTTFLGQPIEPHRPSGVEASHYYCSDCGTEVTNDGGGWFHEDQQYEPSDD